MGKWRVMLLSVVTLTTTGTSAYAAPEVGWSIRQTAKGSPMGNGATILITPTGMRTSDAKSGVSMFTKGPAWNVVLFNTQTRNIYQTSLAQWIQSIQKRKAGGRFEGANWKRGGTTTIAGVRAYEFALDRPVAGRTVRGPDGKPKAIPSISAARLFVAQDIVTPPQVSDLVSKIYGVPDCQRIPLRMEVTEAGKRPVMAVDTVSISRVNVPDAMFQVPGGLTPVKSDMEVFIDRKSMDALDDMLKDL